MLRWHLQQGRSVIPKSTKPHRIAENFDVFDFELTADELAAIDALDTGQRGGPDPKRSRSRPSAGRSPRTEASIPADGTSAASAGPYASTPRPAPEHRSVPAWPSRAKRSAGTATTSRLAPAKPTAQLTAPPNAQYPRQ